MGDQESGELVLDPPGTSLGAPVVLTKEEQQVADALFSSRLSERTRKAYRQSWTMFARWANARGGIPWPPKLPLDGQVVLAFVVHRVQDKCSPSQIGVDLAALRAVHEAALAPFDGVAAHAALEGYRRRPESLEARTGKARGVDLATLRKVVEAQIPADRDPVTAARDRALVLVGWFGALRREELAAIRVQDVQWEGTRGVIVHIPRSKTDQRGVGQSVALYPDGGSPVDPVAALKSWLVLRPDTLGDSMWGHRKGGSRGPWVPGLTPGNIVLMLKARAAAAGVDYRVSGHSLRRGWITAAAVSGAQSRDIMAQSRHRDSRTVDGYIEEATKLGRVPRVT